MQRLGLVGKDRSWWPCSWTWILRRKSPALTSSSDQLRKLFPALIFCLRSHGGKGHGLKLTEVICNGDHEKTGGANIKQCIAALCFGSSQLCDGGKELGHLVVTTFVIIVSYWELAL